jgi:hypothetical protein
MIFHRVDTGYMNDDEVVLSNIVRGTQRRARYQIGSEFLGVDTVGYDFRPSRF